jgi:hypothetical protein
VVTTALSGAEIDVWALTDYSPTADGVWQYGQAEIYSHKVAFFAVRSTSMGEGWAAIDEVIASEEYQGNCPTLPDSSAVTTVAPDTTTTTKKESGEIVRSILFS